MMRAMNLAWSVLKGRDFPADIALSPRPMSAEGWPSEGQEEPEENPFHHDPTQEPSQPGLVGALKELCGDMTDEQCHAIFDKFMQQRGQGEEEEEEEEVGEDEYE